MSARKKKTSSFMAVFIRRIVVAVGAVILTMLLFLSLPLIQMVTSNNNIDTIVQAINTTELPPPPPPMEEEKEEEKPQEEEKPPELNEPMEQQLDLSQLELALNPGGFGDGPGGDFAVKLNTVTATKGNSEEADALFSLADLDQKPRVIYQPGPQIDAAMKRKAPATVHIIFIVDQRGRVENPIVQKSSDPVFEKPAMAAVRQWKFEPGKRQGQPVRFRMRVPITFPKE